MIQQGVLEKKRVFDFTSKKEARVREKGGEILFLFLRSCCRGGGGGERKVPDPSREQREPAVERAAVELVDGPEQVVDGPGPGVDDAWGGSAREQAQARGKREERRRAAVFVSVPIIAAAAIAAIA